MHELKIHLDPCNAAQFYACCGLFELSEITNMSISSHFVLEESRPRQAIFVLRTEIEFSLQTAVEALRQGKYRPLTRSVAENPPSKDSIAPVLVNIFGQTFTLDWWLDEFYFKATSLKCWAGQVTTQKLFLELPKLLPRETPSFVSEAFTSTRFGVDPRSAWVSLDLGYSPNEQGQESQTYPVVEMLAAFGLQGFRPSGDRAHGFNYHLWLSPLHCSVARIASAKPWQGLRTSAYKFDLGERGSYKFFCFSTLVSS